LPQEVFAAGMAVGMYSDEGEGEDSRDKLGELTAPRRVNGSYRSKWPRSRYTY
jgi:hypothetical protein